jgi:anthranilate synthase
MVRRYEFTVEPSPATAGAAVQASPAATAEGRPALSEAEGVRVSTHGLPREGASAAFHAAGSRSESTSDHKPGEYAANVSLAREAFRRGDLFEVVLSQTLSEPCDAPPSELFRRLRERNPAPYGFLLNLGQDEYLVGASPEMYVRVDGERVETCPLSGTIARGADPLADAARIRELLNSKKDESELTMCTDVDRNDKSRICRPGTVQVIGRRQIELYSRLIHTADHVEGMLAPEYDAMDAFLTHAWAVTVTGAPKRWAMQFVEDHEKSARAWYGGAVGLIGFDGNMNTGLTLRTVRIKDGRAEVRVGATLLYDSDPEAEEAETRLKASALVDAVRLPVSQRLNEGAQPAGRPGAGKRVLLVDHEDSFVHTLADYFRQTGCEVTTLRAGFPYSELDVIRPDLVVLSPGPGQPSDFNVSATLAACVERRLPVFGVCLGLQGMVEHFGGKLGLLDEPVHGKPSPVCVQGESRLFRDLPRSFEAGRYHSLYARPADVPECLAVTAVTEDGVVMAVEHKTLPVAGIQFHPESIMTLGGSIGLRLIHNVVAELCPV